jgi:hypothetical protein
MALKISYYRDETVKTFITCLENGDDATARQTKDSDAISISVRFARLTSKFEKLNITPHFIKIFSSEDMKNFAETIPEISDRFEKLTVNQRKYNHVTYMELFETDMTSFLTKETYDDSFVRFIIFQILYTIAATQSMLPGWRHNDLSTNNVLVKKMDDPIAAKYSINGKEFYIQSDKKIAIIDFDFVNADHLRLRNQRVTSGDFKVTSGKNISYDSHFFLKSVLKCLGSRKSKFDGPDTRSFLKSLVLQTEDRLQSEQIQFDPNTILQHEYFSPLLTKIPVQHSYRFSK